MAENTKTYRIVINGIEESVSQVEALKRSLDALDERIKALASQTINVNTNGVTSSSDDGKRASELETEDKLLKQIQSTEEQIANARREDYQKLLEEKDTLKDIVSSAKERAAAERLSSGGYDNTMKGLKQELSDIKTVMQTTDLGDEKFQELTQRAGELTNKLKELETAYGQFGRNVGNYTSAFDGIKNISIQIGGTTREFNSVRDASRQLTQELKAMVINGKENTEEFKQLSDAVHNFEMASRRAESAVNDLKASSQGMDSIMDMMESFGSLGQISQGFSAFFGIDDTQIERSIQKLVGLQNAMQGIEKIRQQLNTQEGIGAIFSKGSDKIDAFTAKLNKANIAMLGTGKAATVASYGIKALGTAIKGIATLGLAVVIDLLMEGISKMAEFVKTWVKGDADLISSTDVANAAIESQNKELEKNLNLIKQRQDAHQLSAMDAAIEKEKAYAKALFETRDAMLKREEAYRDQGIVQSGQTDLFLSNSIGDKGVTTLGGFKEGIKDIKDFADRFDYLSERVAAGKDIMDGFFDTAEDAKDELVHLSKRAGGDFVNAMNKFADGTKEGTRSLVEYIAHMDELTNGKYSQAIKLGIDKGYLDGQFKQAWNLYEGFKRDVQTDPVQINLNFENLANQFIEAADKSKTAYYKRMRENLDASYNALSAEDKKKQEERYKQARAAIDKQEKETRKSVLAGEKRTSDERRKQSENAEKQLIALRIANMKEGLNKVLKQLEEERRQKIAKIRTDGVMVRELELETNKLYDKKIEDAKKEHAEKVKKIYQELWRDIYEMQIENQKLQLELAENASENISVNVENVKDMNMRQNISSYGIQNREQLSPSTRESLGLLSEDGKETKEVEKLVSLYRQVQTALNEYQTLKSKSEDKIYESLQKRKKLEEDLSNLEVKKGTLSEESYNLEKEFLNKQIEDEKRAIAAYKKQIDEALDSQKEAVDKSLEIYTEYDKELKKKYGDSYQPIANALSEQGYSENLGQLLEQRMSAIDAYWNYRINAEKIGVDKVLEERKRLENLEYDKRVSETWSSTKDQEKKINESYDKGEIESEKEKNDLIESLWVENQTKLENLEKQHTANLVKITKERDDKIQSLNAEYFNNSMQELRDFQTAISQQEGKTTVTNSWGIVNLKQTNENNRKLLASYKKFAEQINKKRSEIQSAYDNGIIIDRDIYEQNIRELDSFSADLGEKMDKVKEELSLNAQIQKLASGINEWVQSIGGAVSSILSSIWDAQDAEYERYIEELDKSIDAAKKKYDEMDALAQEHADNMKSIEDDIASAQGDARDHLLDRYAAEIDAQRRAVAEKKKAENEQEKLEKKKEKAEIEQRKRQKKRDLIQAAINTAMSISMAAVNKWPVPAIPMMAIAAAVGAAQIAAISAQQYAKGGLLPNKDGGVIQGKSHREGGIKVLGGVAEVEGKEFITNKVTTEKNVELLEYINTKKRKIKLDDLIEFYGNDSQVKRNISTVRTKFADGGQLPFLRTDIDINDRLIQAMEDYANKPTVVSVVEVMDKMQSVNNVRTMAGVI